MGWLVEGHWSTRDGKHWIADISDLTGERAYSHMSYRLPGNAPLPNGLTVYDVRWTHHHDNEGEFLSATATHDGMSFTIYND